MQMIKNITGTYINKTFIPRRKGLVVTHLLSHDFSISLGNYCFWHCVIRAYLRDTDGRFWSVATDIK